MKKALVLNTLHTTIQDSGCNLIKKANWYNSTLSSKLFHEKEISEKFNNISSGGFVFQDERVFAHNLFVENQFKGKSTHGVYRFTDGESAKYQVYFGPIIEIGEKELIQGCMPKFGMGCNIGSIGCKGPFGCSASGGNTQYVNFLNDEKNQKAVQVLNNHFGLRKNYDRDRDDYIYRCITQSYLNEWVKERYDQIRSQYTGDVENFYRQGLGFVKTIDTPSPEDVFSQAMLFGSNSKKKAIMTDLSAFRVNVSLSRFDVWYFPVVKGMLRRIIEKIPVISSFLSKEDVVEPTTRLEDSNIAIVEKTYEDDFNAQEKAEAVSEMVKNSVVGKIPVTIAVKRKLGFWKRIFHPVEYDFHTYMIDAIEG